MTAERKLVALFCTIAAVRVFVFCAAFPFFNNVDEQAHVDLVMKYARGEVPRGLGHFSSEAAQYFAVYGTPEYLTAPEQIDSGKFPPPLWTLPADERDKGVAGAKAWWQAQENPESGEPPLYYMIAGAWLDLGRLCGIDDGYLLYWIRFLNVFIAVALVWAGFVAARIIFPDRQFVQLAVPLLLAVWPQSTFYSVQSDVLSPLVFGIAFIGLIKFLQAERPPASLAAWTGLALAATCLIKTANIALLVVAATALILKMRRDRAGRLGGTLRASSVLVLSAAAPIVFWFMWNAHAFGDLTATAAKIEFLGWTRKPIGAWLPHPLFTLSGLREFWPELIASFWRGEFVWHGHRLTSASMDTFYWISSTLAFALSGMVLFRRAKDSIALRSESLWLALLSLTVLVLLMGLLSIAFDFGPCLYPSNQHPYFTSGRLLCAATLPFFLVYVYALDVLFGRMKRNGPRLALLGAIVVFIVISQVLVNGPVLSSRYNFFHLNRPA